MPAGLHPALFFSALLFGLLQAPAAAQGLGPLANAIREARAAPRDATGEFWRAESQRTAAVRNALRDWVLRQLPPGIPEAQRDLHLLSAALNQQLEQARLSPPAGDPPREALLYAVEVELRRQPQVPAYIELRLHVGTECGDDITGYFLQWAGGSWKTQIAIDSGGIPEGVPAEFDDLHLSEPDSNGNRLALALRYAVHCASAWTSFTYHIHRVHSDGTAEALLSARHGFWEGYSEQIDYRLTPEAVLMEFASSSIDVAIHNRPVVLYYRLDGDRLARVEPVALRPFDFVDEWWTSEWAEAARWSAAGDQLRAFHETYRHERMYGEFGLVQRCSNVSGWQISYDLYDADSKATGIDSLYFLVRQTGQGQYVMLDADVKRQPGCPGESRSIEADRPTLFPK